MFKADIPFEIHLTIDNLSSAQQQAFINFCLANNAKPLLIQLSRGSFINQPMLGKVVTGDKLSDILLYANELSGELTDNNFTVKRLKIEVPSGYAETLPFESGFRKYFEWHGKVNYINVAGLMQICDEHLAHLSSNSLKNEDNLRFITLREFGSKQQFESRVQHIENVLLHEGWNIIKQESEYCIYDNNVFLDNGWLPQ